MPTAYILVNCTLGSEEKIITEIAKLPDVKEVRGTYGVHGRRDPEAAHAAC